MVDKKKKDRKRKQLSEEPSDDDNSYGTENETSSKKTKGESRFLKCQTLSVTVMVKLSLGIL